MDTRKIVDRLATVKSRIASLQCEAGDLADALKAQGLGTYEGSGFNATVYDSLTRAVDWKAVANHFEPSPQLLTAHTKDRTSVSLKLTAKE